MRAHETIQRRHIFLFQTLKLWSQSVPPVLLESNLGMKGVCASTLVSSTAAGVCWSTVKFLPVRSVLTNWVYLVCVVTTPGIFFCQIYKVFYHLFWWVTKYSLHWCPQHPVRAWVNAFTRQWVYSMYYHSRYTAEGGRGDIQHTESISKAKVPNILY